MFVISYYGDLAMFKKRKKKKKPLFDFNIPTYDSRTIIKNYMFKYLIKRHIPVFGLLPWLPQPNTKDKIQSYFSVTFK